MSVRSVVSHLYSPVHCHISVFIELLGLRMTRLEPKQLEIFVKIVQETLEEIERSLSYESDLPKTSPTGNGTCAS